MTLPRLHLVTDAAVTEQSGFVPTACTLLERYGPRIALHLRMPGRGGRAVHDLAAELRPVALASGARFLVNDRVDIAMAVRADGVQLGSRSMPAARVRPLLGRALIGVSVHGVAEAVDAGAADIDFVVLGTIHESTSHPHGTVLGESALAEAAARARVPVIGIGGMTPERAAAAHTWGAHGVAVLGGVWRAADAVEAIASFLEALEGNRGD